MKKLLILLLFISSLNSYSQKLDVVGGYFPYWRSTDNINFENYNYLYFAFIFANPDGTLAHKNSTAQIAFNNFMSATDGIGSKRLISVSTTGMSVMAQDPAARLVFADELRKFCRDNEMDGIDMDWEAINNVTDRDNFTLLMKDIRAEIDSTDLEFVVTIGFGNYWLQWYENEALDQADFLQIMIYDQTGTWASSPYGPHASMDHYKQAENYWVGRGYSRDKLVMGLPYYGYRFTDETGGLALAVTYTDIMTKFPNAQPSDNLLIDNSGHYFFNGADLIKEKVDYAKDNGFKGVFVWELAQDDATKPNSLDAALANSVGISGPISPTNSTPFNAFPNPAINQVSIDIPNETPSDIQVLTVTGKLVAKYNNISTIPVNNLPSGVYFLKVVTKNGKHFHTQINK